MDWWLGIYLTLSHLSGLLSFGMPYLIPFVKKEPCTGMPVTESYGFLSSKRWQRPALYQMGTEIRLQKNDSDDWRKPPEFRKVQGQEEND